MTLEDILRKYFGFSHEAPLDGKEYVEAYNRMTSCLCEIGSLTGYSGEIGNIVDAMDKIDSRDGEV